MFISIDGGDGVGKSTQISILKDRLEANGFSTLLCRDPGSTLLGEKIREILLSSCSVPIGDRSELFLFMAARSQLLEEKVRPALEKGQIVIIDRFLLSTVVYQGYAAGLPVEEIWSVGKVAIGSFWPDFTFLLDLDPEAAHGRIDRPLDRMELKGKEYHKRVRSGFLQGFKEFPGYFSGEGVVLDASLPIETIADRIWSDVQKKLKDTPSGR